MHEGVRAIVNLLGAALAARAHPDLVRMLGILDGVSGPREASVWGHGLRLDPLNAASANAIAGNLLDFDDTHLATVMHPAAPVVSAALALGEQQHLRGDAVVTAIVLGAETSCRIGLGVSPGHYDRGWHITASAGVFGAAAAAARLLRLSLDQTAHALGIAASLSCGVVQNLPTAAKNAAVGASARNGVLAALMAQRGGEAAPDAIEGSLGWARASGDEPDARAMLDGLGTRWEFAGNTYKPYPCGIVMHAVIDACLELREQHGLVDAPIAEVEVAGDALLLARGDRLVKDPGDARVSLHHCAAVALLGGTPGPAQFAPAAVRDDATVALRRRVKARLDDALPRGAARVRIVLEDGRAFEHTVLQARGSAARPLTDADLDTKLRDLAEHGRWRGDPNRLLRALWALREAHDVYGVMALAR